MFSNNMYTVLSYRRVDRLTDRDFQHVMKLFNDLVDQRCRTHYDFGNIITRGFLLPISEQLLIASWNYKRNKIHRFGYLHQNGSFLIFYVSSKLQNNLNTLQTKHNLNNIKIWLWFTLFWHTCKWQKSLNEEIQNTEQAGRKMTDD